MRCLRCALDYGPDIRYCDRCGRALSRTPGAEADAGTEFSIGHDASFLYTTFSPPGAAQFTPAGAAGAGERSTQAAPITTTLERPLADETMTDAPDLRDGAPAELPTDLDEPLAASERLAPPRARAALPDVVRIEPPAPVEQEAPAPAIRLDSEIDSIRTRFRENPRFIGQDDVADRLRSRRAITLPRPTRALLVVGLVVILVAALGIVGYGRYAAYTRDLRDARQLTSRQQFGAAIARYQLAIADWPLHSAATQEQGQAVATATAIAAQAAAVAEQQQAVAAAEAARPGVYAAWTRMRRQNVKQ
ncbi:MAG TPA: hypothetical protein VHB98_21035 [Chloroflexota bacterium]|nr:hypothetical protein [Chloroflexota bacterium]